MNSIQINQTMSINRLKVQVWITFFFFVVVVHNHRLMIFNRWTMMMILDNIIVLQKILMEEGKQLYLYLVCCFGLWLIRISLFFALEESVTTKKFHHHSKHSSRKYLRTTTTNVYIERDISISSSSDHLWTSHRLRNLLLLLLLFRFKRIGR